MRRLATFVIILHEALLAFWVNLLLEARPVRQYVGGAWYRVQRETDEGYLNPLWVREPLPAEEILEAETWEP